MNKNKNETTLKDVGSAIGIGLIAGFAGTVAITLSQMIEMKITGRKGSDKPVNAVREVFDIKPVTESKSQQVSRKIHWTYGTSLGLIRSALSLAGLRGMAATAIHFVSIWGGQLIMLPALRVAKPITKEKPKAIAIGVFHHLVYAATVGCVFDAIYCGEKHKNGKKNKEKNSGDKFEMYRREKRVSNKNASRL